MSYSPKRPDGHSPEALFDQWAWDSISKLMRVQDVPGARVLNTTRGVAVIPDPVRVKKGAFSTPLSNAVWVQERGKIYGVRGGYLFEFNPDGTPTGKGCPFGECSLMDSYLAWDDVGHKLWASSWGDFASGERISGNGLYVFDLDAMAVAKFYSTQNMGFRSSGDYVTAANSGYTYTGEFETGPRRIGFMDGYIFGTWFAYSFGRTEMGIFWVHASDPPAFGLWGRGWYWNDGGTAWTGFWLDKAHGHFWSGNDVGLNMYRQSPTWDDWTGWGWDNGNPVFCTFCPYGQIPPPDYGHSTADEPLTAVYGIEGCPVDDHIYMVTRDYQKRNLLFAFPRNDLIHDNSQLQFTDFSEDGRLVKIDMRSGTIADKEWARPGTIQPKNVRWSESRQKLYIPTGQDNAVIEVDPGSHEVSRVYEGFDCPHDIVVTDSGVLAVQVGKVGLKSF